MKLYKEKTLKSVILAIRPYAGISAVAYVTLISPFAAMAQTATFNGTEDAVNTSALTKAGSWSNGIAPNDSSAAGYEYLLEGDNNKFRSPTSGNVTVYANPFRVGTVGGTGGQFRECNTTKNALTFKNGLVLAKGSFYRENSRMEENSLIADVTVTAPESAPFSFYGNTPGGYGNFVMNGAWSSAAGTKITFESKVSEANPLFRVKFPSTSDLSAFHGTMRVASKSSGKGPCHLLMQSVSMPGTVSVGSGGVFGALDATSEVSVGTLALDSGARIAIPATASTNGVIKVTGSFSCSGSVQIDLSAMPLPSSGRTPILVLASGCTGSMDENAFAFAAPDSAYESLPKNAALVVDTDDITGERTLYFSCRPVVMMTKNESRDMEYDPLYAHSAVTNATYWSDSLPVHGGADYVVPNVVPNGNTGMRTPFTTGSYVLPANSLSFASGAAMSHKTKQLTITNLVLYGGSGINIMKPRHGHAVETFYNMTLDGEILETHSGGDITVYGYFHPPVKAVPAIKGYTIKSEITGDGDLVFKANGSSTWPNGYFAATGINTNFSGTIRLTMSDGTTSNKDLTPDDIYARFDVEDGRNLGGPLAAFNAKAIQIDHACMLRTTGADIKLAEPTRGIYVGTKARFNVQSGHTLSITSPLAVNGTLVKEGVGELALGGTLRFGSDGASETPTEGSNNLVVTNGTLRILAAEACNGLSIGFAEGAKLVIPVGTSDADLARYGLVNTKAATPFSTSAANGKIVVKFDCDGLDESKSYMVGICTVPSSAAASVLSMISVEKPAVKGFSVVVETVADGDNITVVGNLQRRGFVITFR